MDKTPPGRVQVLRLALLAQTVLVVVLWLGVWRSLRGYAWVGVETDLFERGLSYLLVLAPTIPVNLLAVIWLGRGGRRALLYLASAGVLVAVQQILLLTPVDPGRSVAAGTVFAMATGPVAFVAVAIALTERTKHWLRGDRAPARNRVVGVETAVWGLAAVLAVGVGTSMHQWVAASTETGPPVGRFDESDVWARMEEAVTNAAADRPTFPGFTSRAVEVDSCGYRTASGLRTYRYRIAYELAAFPDPADADAFATAVRDQWSGEDYRLRLDGPDREDVATIAADREDELNLVFKLGEPPTIEVRSDCLERVDETVPCLDPQGGVGPEADRIEGVECRDAD